MVSLKKKLNERQDAMDKIILIVCAVLFIQISVILIWWLKEGKQRFIEKRCPEKLEKEKISDENDKE